jgi:hypothetical protein
MVYEPLSIKSDQTDSLMFLSERSRSNDVHLRFSQSASDVLCNIAHSSREKLSCSDLDLSGETVAWSGVCVKGGNRRAEQTER